MHIVLTFVKPRTRLAGNTPVSQKLYETLWIRLWFSNMFTNQTALITGSADLRVIGATVGQFLPRLESLPSYSYSQVWPLR